MLSYHLFLCSYLILYYLIFSSLVKNYWPTDFHPSEPNTTIRGSNHRHRHHVEPICTRNIDLGPGASKNTGKTHRGAFLVFVLGATSWKSMRKSPTWYITYLSACRTMNSYDVWFYSTHVPQELHGEGNEGTVFFLVSEIDSQYRVWNNMPWMFFNFTIPGTKNVDGSESQTTIVWLYKTL